MCGLHVDGEADEAAAAADGKEKKKKKSKKDLDGLFAALGDEEGGAAANGVEAAEVRVLTVTLVFFSVSVRLGFGSHA